MVSMKQEGQNEWQKIERILKWNTETFVGRNVAFYEFSRQYE